MRVTKFDKFLDRHYHAVMCTCQVLIAFGVVQIALLLSFFLGRALWG